MFNKNYPALSHLICLINIEQEPLKSSRVIVHSLQAPYIIQTVKTKHGATKMQNYYLDFLVQALFIDVDLYYNNDPRVNLGSFSKN